MQIANNSVVSIQYTLKNSDGQIIDQSAEGQPLTYLHGHRNITVSYTHLTLPTKA